MLQLVLSFNVDFVFFFGKFPYTKQIPKKSWHKLNICKSNINIIL